MQRIPVTSSNVVSVGWANGTLEVEFKSGIYRYLGVPEDVYVRMKAANSVGRFLNEHVKDVFPHSKVAA